MHQTKSNKTDFKELIQFQHFDGIEEDEEQIEMKEMEDTAPKQIPNLFELKTIQNTQIGIKLNKGESLK